MQCYEKNPSWAACKAGCTPGIDPFDIDGTPWTCNKLGARTEAPGHEETCNRVRVGASFWSGKVMHETVAATEDVCRITCSQNSWCGVWTFHPGQAMCLLAPHNMQYGFTPPPEYLWKPQPNCRLAAADMPLQQCSAVGEDCSNTRCCQAAGEQCFSKDLKFSMCRPSCQEGNGWKCEKLGPRICHSCQPVMRSKPSVVIPTFERDLCKVIILAKSLAMHDPENFLGDVYLLWVSREPWWKHAEKVEEIKKAILDTGTKQFHLLDFSGQLQDQKCLVWAFDGSKCIEYLQGWHAQMSLKLKVAHVLPTEYYLVLDSKNTLLSDIKEDTFFSNCNTAKIWGYYRYEDIPTPHREWYNTSAKLLGVTEVPQIYWPTSITPAVLHKTSVLQMLEHIGEHPDPYQVCSGPMCKWFGMQATEFTLYYWFIAARGDRHCTHSVEVPTTSPEPPRGLRRTVTLWRGHPPKMNFEQCQEVLNNKTKPLTFGLQAGLLGALDILGAVDDSEANSTVPSLRHNVSECVYKIYYSAGLFHAMDDKSGRQAVSKCFM